MPRPFQYLQQNIDKIKFDCDPKYIPEYKRAFSAVLNRMDKFFVQQNLYDVVDYKPIVENMLASYNNFSFKIDEDIAKRHWAGVHKRISNGKRVIGMDPEYMGKGTTTEGLLCHEFIHQLTLGPEVLTYTENGDKYEVQLPQRSGSASLAGYKRNISKRKVEGLDAGLALDGGFICEAFTELVKQEIYTEDESDHSYSPQTSLIKFLNDLTGTKVNIKDFFKGDLPNYVKSLGRENFEKFNKLCDEFQSKFNNDANINPALDNDYLSAQDLICKTILQNVEDQPDKYSPADFIRIASSIMAEAPSLKTDPNYCKRFKPAVITAGNAITLSQPLKSEEKKQFSALLKATLNKSIKEKKGTVQLPFSSDFSFKKTTNGFALNFKNGTFVSSSVFPTRSSSKIVAKIGTNEMAIEVSENGAYKITATDANKQSQTINIAPNKSNADELLIKDEKGEEVFKLNFKLETKKLKRNIQENLSLLSNFKRYNNLKTIINENAKNKVQTVKKITANSGDEYLVANSSKMSMFYKLTPNGHKHIDVMEQPIEENTDISQKFATSKDEKTAMYGYRPSDIKTDETSLAFTLQDGTTFVRYFDNDGIEHIGEQFDPLKDGKTVIVPVANETLFSRGNEDLFDLTSAKQKLRDFEAEEINL